MYFINRSDNQAKNFAAIKSGKGEGNLPPKNPTAGTAGPLREQIGDRGNSSYQWAAY